MYEVDDNDRVRELTEFPQSSTGAPLPLVAATNGSVVVAYRIQDATQPTDFGSSRSATAPSEVGAHAVICFRGCLSHSFGAPNDETIQAHPLASRGLGSYGAFEIENSSWLRGLAAMNSVHRRHRPEMFEGYRHIALTFHDETFECVCRRYEIHRQSGPIATIVPFTMGILFAR